MKCINKKGRKRPKKSKVSQSVNVTRNFVFSNSNNQKDKYIKFKRNEDKHKSSRTRGNTTSRKRVNSTMVSSKSHRFKSKENIRLKSKRPTENKKYRTAYNDNKNGFFITSVDENNQKENQNGLNQQSEVNKEETEKPMFESIKKNTNYGSFNNLSRKTRNKATRLIYTNQGMTKTQYSQASLKSSSKLPPVLRKNAKTSMDFVHKNKYTLHTTRNPDDVSKPYFGFQSEKNKAMKINSKLNSSRKRTSDQSWLSSEQFRSLLSMYYTQAKEQLTKLSN